MPPPAGSASRRPSRLRPPSPPSGLAGCLPPVPPGEGACSCKPNQPATSARPRQQSRWHPAAQLAAILWRKDARTAARKAVVDGWLRQPNQKLKDCCALTGARCAPAGLPHGRVTGDRRALLPVWRLGEGPTCASPCVAGALGLEMNTPAGKAGEDASGETKLWTLGKAVDKCELPTVMNCEGGFIGEKTTWKPLNRFETRPVG